MSKRPGKAVKSAADAAVAAAPQTEAVSPPPPPLDPALESAKAGASHWARCVEQTVQEMEQTEAVLRSLAGRNARDQLELQLLRVEVGFLATLQLDELRAHRAATAAGNSGNGSGVAGDGKGGAAKPRASSSRGRRSLSGAASKGQRAPSQSDEGGAGGATTSGGTGADAPPSGAAGEAAAPTALDEKKRQRVHNVIMSAFMSSPPTPTVSAGSPTKAAALGAGRRASPSMSPKPTSTPVTPTPAAMDFRDADATNPFGLHPHELHTDGTAHSPSKHSARSQSSASAHSSLSVSGGGARRAGGVGGAGTGNASATSELSLAGRSILGGSDAQRPPKDVPLPVWEELLSLRNRRLAVVARVERTGAAMAGQLEKLAVLQEQVMVARHGLRSAFEAYVRAGGLKEERPPPPTTNSPPGSSAKARGSSANSRLSTSSRVGPR